MPLTNTRSQTCIDTACFVCPVSSILTVFSPSCIFFLPTLCTVPCWMATQKALFRVRAVAQSTISHLCRRVAAARSPHRQRRRQAIMVQPPGTGWNTNKEISAQASELLDNCSLSLLRTAASVGSDCHRDFARSPAGQTTDQPTTVSLTVGTTKCVIHAR